MVDLRIDARAELTELVVLRGDLCPNRQSHQLRPGAQEQINGLDIIAMHRPVRRGCPISLPGVSFF